MTTHPITYYPSLIKSYLVDKTKNSVFNTPIVRTAFVTSAAVVTGITTVYFIKKINDTVRVALNKPLESACIAAAIVSTGVVIAYYPVWTMILFVGISFILLNRQAYNKIQDINKAYQDFFINSPFIKKIQISFGANPKLVNNPNSTDNTTNTHALQLDLKELQLDLKELQFRAPQSDEISSSDTNVPSVITEAEEATSEDVGVDNVEVFEEDNTVSDTPLSVVATLVEEVTPEHQNVDDLQLPEENDIEIDTILPIVPTEIESIEEVPFEDVTVDNSQSFEKEEVPSEDVTVDNSQSFEKDDIAPVEPTHTEFVEQVASEKSAPVAPLPLGLVELMDLNFINSQTNSRNSAGNSLILGAAKQIHQFNLAGLNQPGEQLTDSSCVTLPIQPVALPSVGTWANRKPLEKLAKPILINPLMPKSGISANKMIKTAGTVLNLLKKVPK